MRLLEYRAGPAALRVLRERGLSSDTLSVLAGPASGPKWIPLAGLDRALLDSALLEERPRVTASAPRVSGGVTRSRRERSPWDRAQSPWDRAQPRLPFARKLLVGASAGAWRMMALGARRPEEAHRRLLDGYIGQVFPDDFTAAYVTGVYREMIGKIFDGEEAAHILDHPVFDVAAHTVRVRRPWGWRSRYLKQAQMVSLGWTGLMQAVSRTGTDRVLERVLFHSRPGGVAGFDGHVVALTAENLVDATIASGTVPFYMEPVRDPAGAPAGLYMDGGLSDYHLREAYSSEGITLFPHFQRRIVPLWFDRYWKRREPGPAVLANVLQVYPSAAFVAELPGGTIPERRDFFTFAREPEERIRRWREVAARSERLGAELLDDLSAGRIPDLARPF